MDTTERIEQPSFKRKEIVVEMFPIEGIGSATTEKVAEVLYVGAQQEYYKPGMKILFDAQVGREIKYFKQSLWKIDSEQSVICEIQ